MARKKKCPPSGANNAYLISFGDTMTALLAFFIVLNSLAEEQTGANLHSGTGSFVHALQMFGMPGLFGRDRSALPFQMDETSPQYIVPTGEDHEPEPNPSGPDDIDDQVRMIDRELEDFQRFFNNMEQWHDVESVPDVAGEVSFDIFNSLNSQPPYLSQSLMEAMIQIAPLLRSDNYEVEVTVWATTPAVSSWSRAVRIADALKTEYVTRWRLSPLQAKRLQTGGRVWISSDDERPVLSITSRRLERP